MIDEDRSYSFNFWPAFADLMLCLILILLLVIGGAYFSTINIRSIQDKQKQISATLLTPGRTLHEFAGGVEIRDQQDRLMYSLAIDPHDPMLQIISFSDSILFNIDSYDLKPSGREALLDVGRILRAHLGDIAEVQIRGHADTLRTKRYKDNLELASLRANAVFRFLTEQGSIDPSEHLVSATSFGEFSPVQRKRDAPFGKQELGKANGSEALRQANRRIELVLFFRRPQLTENAVSPQNAP